MAGPPTAFWRSFPTSHHFFGERGSPLSGRVMDRKKEKGKKKHSYLFRIYRQRAFLYHHTLTKNIPLFLFRSSNQISLPFYGELDWHYRIVTGQQLGDCHTQSVRYTRFEKEESDFLIETTTSGPSAPNSNEIPKRNHATLIRVGNTFCRRAWGNEEISTRINNMRHSHISNRLSAPCPQICEGRNKLGDS